MIRQYDPRLFCISVAIAAAAVALPATAQVTEVTRYQQHDTARAQPPVVRPATASTPERAGRAPSDATVLFDGRDHLFRVVLCGDSACHESIACSADGFPPVGGGHIGGNG